MPEIVSLSEILGIVEQKRKRRSFSNEERTTILFLIYFVGMSYREIAAHYKRPHTAIQMLNKAFKEGKIKIFFNKKDVTMQFKSKDLSFITPNQKPISFNEIKKYIDTGSLIAVPTK